jgi:hypothetical protein
MRRLLIAGLLFHYILQGNLFSQDLIRKRAGFLTDSILKTRGEAYIAIPNNRLKASHLIPGKLIFDKFTDSLTYFYVNLQSFKHLTESGIDFYYVIPPSLTGSIHMAVSVNEVLNGSGYPTYLQYLAIMDSFRLRYPSICRIDTIGYSKTGKLILAARLHSGNYKPGDRPVIMYSSTIHGDEPLGYVLMLRILDDLLKGYGLNNDCTDILNEMVILINPLANPDGTYFTADTTIYGAIRENRNYVDLNRDFPERVKGDDPINFNWQPENRAMMEYTWKYKPSLSANFHGGSEVVNYPWDAVPEKHPDDQWFHMISKEFADTLRKLNQNFGNLFPPDGITNGYAWYVVYGGRQDYVTYFLNGREVTIELSNEKIPLATSLSFYWLANKYSLINYLKEGLYGIWGVVTDSEYGTPIKSKVEIPGHDQLNSFVNSDQSTGKLFRYLYEGNYDFQVTSDGYATKNLTGIHVLNHQRTDLSIKLTSLKQLVEKSDILIIPNPFSDKFTFLVKAETQEDCEVRIYDYNGRLVYTGFFISIPGVNQMEVDLSNNNNGIYTLKLSMGNRIIRRKIVKVR